MHLITFSLSVSPHRGIPRHDDADDEENGGDGQERSQHAGYLLRRVGIKGIVRGGVEQSLRGGDDLLTCRTCKGVRTPGDAGKEKKIERERLAYFAWMRRVDFSVVCWVGFHEGVSYARSSPSLPVNPPAFTPCRAHLARTQRRRWLARREHPGQPVVVQEKGERESAGGESKVYSRG